MHIQDSKNILTFVKENVGDFEPEKITNRITEVFVTHLRDGKLIKSNSVNGWSAYLFRNREEQQTDKDKVLQIVSEALMNVHNTRAKEFEDKFYINLRYRLDELRLLNNYREPSPEPSPEITDLKTLAAEKRAKNQERFKQYSLLHQTQESAEPIQKEMLDAVNQTYFYNNPNAKEYFLNFIKSSPNYSAVDFETKTKLIDEALNFEKCLIELFHPKEPLNKIQREELLKDCATYIQKRVHGLSPGEKTLVMGSYGTSTDTFQGFRMQLRKLPRYMLEKLPLEIRHLIENEETLHDPKAFVEETMAMALRQLEKEIPGFDEPINPLVQPILDILLYDESKKLPDSSISTVIPKYIKDEIEVIMQNGLLGTVLDLSGPGQFQEVLEWICKNGCRVNKTEDREKFIKDLNKFIAKQILNHTGDPTELIHNYVKKMFDKGQGVLSPDLLQLMGCDMTFGSGSIWLEIEKDRNGLYTVLIYANGKALSHHFPKGDKVQWPLRIEHVNPKDLRSDFFQTFLTMHLEPEFDSEMVAHPDDLYKTGIIKMLMERGQVKENSWPTRTITGHTSDSIINHMLINADKSMDTVIAEMRIKALIAYSKQFINENGAFKIPNKEAADSIDAAISNLSDYLETLGDKSQLEALKTTFEEMKIAIVEANAIASPIMPEIPNKDDIFPEPLRSLIKNAAMTTGISADYIKSMKDTICWTFGDQIRPLVEFLIKILPGYAEIQNAPKQPETITETQAAAPSTPVLPERTRWEKKVPKIMQVLTNVYFQYFVTIVKYVLAGLAVYRAGINYSMMLTYLSTAIEYVVPAKYLNWITGTIRNVLFQITRWVLGKIINCFFSTSWMGKLHDAIHPYLHHVEDIGKALNQERTISMEVVVDKDVKLPACTLDLEARYFPMTLSGANEGISAQIDFKWIPVDSPLTLHAVDVPKHLDELYTTVQKLNEEDKELYWQTEMLRLPIPVKGSTCVWDHVEFPEECLKKLQKLALFQQTNSTKSIVLNYQVLAIMDRLARRLPGEIPDHPVDVSHLLMWIKHHAKVIDSDLMDKLVYICKYFHPELDLLNLPADETIKQMGKNSLFNYDHPAAIAENVASALKSIFSYIPATTYFGFMSGIETVSNESIGAVNRLITGNDWQAFDGKIKNCQPLKYGEVTGTQTLFQNIQIAEREFKEFATPERAKEFRIQLIHFFLRLPQDPIYLSAVKLPGINSSEDTFKYVERLGDILNELDPGYGTDTLEDVLYTLVIYKNLVYSNYIYHQVSQGKKLNPKVNLDPIHECLLQKKVKLSHTLLQQFATVFKKLAPGSDVVVYELRPAVQHIKVPNMHTDMHDQHEVTYNSNLFKKPEFQFYAEKVKDPKWTEKLEKLGIESHLPMQDKVIALFTETLFQREDSDISPALSILRLQAFRAQTNQTETFNPGVEAPIYRTYYQKYEINDKINNLEKIISGSNPKMTIPRQYTNLIENGKNNINSLEASPSLYAKILNAKTRSQSEIMAKPGEFQLDISDLNDSQKKLWSALTKQELTDLEMILCEPKDRIVRLLAHLKKNPQLIQNPFYQELLETVIFKSTQLDQQLRASPYMAQALGEWLQEIYKLSNGNGDTTTCLWLIRMGHQVKKYCLKRVPKADVFFPDFQGRLKEIKDKVPTTLKTEWVIIHNQILDEDPSKLSLEECQEGAIELCKYMFLRKQTLDVENRKRFLQWQDKIQELLKDEKYRSRVILEALKTQGIHLDRSFYQQWMTSIDQPWTFTSKDITVNLLVGMTDDLVSIIPQETLKKNATIADAIGQDDVNLLLIERNKWKSEDGKYRIEGVADRGGMRFSVYKIMDGIVSPSKPEVSSLFTNIVKQLTHLITPPIPEKVVETNKEYLFVDQAFSAKNFFIQANIPMPPKSTFWLDASDETFHYLRMEGEETVTLKLRVKSLEKHEYEMCGVIKGKTESQHFLLESAHKHFLRPFSRFCELSNILCTKNVNEDHLSSIHFKPYHLTFDVKKKNGKLVASNEARFAGYTLAQNQSLPSLKGFNSYLLLESGSKSKKVLMPDNQWVTSMAWRGLEKAGSIGSYLADFLKPYDRLLKQKLNQYLDMPFSQTKLYEYDLDEKGQLRSEDPEAMANVTFMYLLQGKKDAAFRACRHLELIAKRAPLTHETATQLYNLAFIPAGLDEFKYVRMRLFAALEENPYIHEWKNTLQVKTPESIDLLQTVVTYRDLMEQSKNPDPLWKISSRQEWFLYRSLTRHAKELLSNQFTKLDDKNVCLKRLKTLEKMGWENAFEVLGLTGPMGVRYRALKAKYGIKHSLIKTAGQAVKDVMMTNSSIPSIGETVEKMSAEATNAVNSHDSGFFRNLLKFASTFMYSHFEDLNVVDLQKKVLRPINNKAPLRDLTEGQFKSLFLSYYFMARGEMGSTKQAELKEMLRLYRGRWGDRQARLLMDYLDGVLELSHLFPAANSLLNNLKENDSTETWENFFRKIHNRALAIHTMQPFSNVGEELSVRFSANGIVNSHIQDLPYMSYPKTAMSILHVISKSYNAWKTRKEVAPLEEPKADSPATAESYKDLEIEDNQIDEQLDQLFSLAFEKVVVPVALADQEKRIEPFTLTDDAAQNHRINRFNASLKAYHEHPNRLAQQIKLIDAEGIWQIYVGVDHLQDSLQKSIETDKLAILNYLNMNNHSRHSISIEDIQNLLLQNDNTTFTQAFKLNEQEIAKIKTMIVRCAVRETRLEQLKRAQAIILKLSQIDPEKDQELYDEKLEELADELAVKRAYTFDKPVRLLMRYLMFELRTKKMIWERQRSCIEKLLFCGHDKAVVELIMGLGKTTTANPIWGSYEADGNSLLTYVWPTALAGTNTRFISEQSSLIFNQIAHLFRFGRSDALSQGNLEVLTVVFKHIIENGDTANMTKEDVQACELRLLEGLFHQSQSSRLFKKGLEEMDMLRNILAMFRKGKAIVDEAHDTFNRISELVFPLMAKFTVKGSYYMVLERCMRLIVDHPVIGPLVDQNNLPRLSHEQYNTIVLELAKTMSEYEDLGIQDNQRAEFIEYVSGNAKKIPDWVEKHAQVSEIALVKGVLEILFPKAAERLIDVNFGASEDDSNGEFARPAEGNNEVKKNSCIRTPYEALVKTFLMIYSKGLNTKQVEKFVLGIRDKAEKEAKVRYCTIEDTEMYKLFKPLISSFDLFKLENKELTPDKWEIIQKAFKHNHDAIQLYTRFYIWKQIPYWKKNLRSNASNMASMFNKILSDTGTPYNDGTYPQHVEMLWDEGTIGEAVSTIAKKCHGIFVLETDSPKEILAETLNRFFKSTEKCVAIIDGGALFKGLSTEFVARQMLKHAEIHMPHIRAVKFFQKGEDGLDRLMWIERGAYHPTPVDSARIPPEECLTYFDGPHAFGADVDQMKDGRAIELISEHEQEETLQRLMQDVFRMRGLKKVKKLQTNGQGAERTQSVYFVMTKASQHKISGDQFPTLLDIVKYGIKNEAAKAQIDNYAAQLQKIHNVVRNAVMEKIVFAPSIYEAIEIFTAFIKVLVSDVEDDPWILYGMIAKEITAKEALEAARKKVWSYITDSKYFTDLEKNGIANDLNALMNPEKGTTPEKVTIYTDGNKSFNPAEDLDREVQVNTETENDQDQDQEQEQEQETRNDIRNAKYAYKEVSWSDQIDSKDKNSWLHYREPRERLNIMANMARYLCDLLSFPLFKLADVYHCASTPLLKAIATAIPNELWTTNNFLPQEVSFMENPAEPGSKEQRDLHEVLIHYTQNDDGTVKIDGVAPMTIQEGGFWRSQLENISNLDRKRKQKTILYDVTLRTVVAGHCPSLAKLRKSKTLTKMEAILMYMNGDVSHSKRHVKALKQWFLENNSKEMKDAFLHIHAQRGKDNYAGSDINVLFDELLKKT